MPTYPTCFDDHPICVEHQASLFESLSSSTDYGPWLTRVHEHTARTRARSVRRSLPNLVTMPRHKGTTAYAVLYHVVSFLVLVLFHKRR